MLPCIMRSALGVVPQFFDPRAKDILCHGNWVVDLPTFKRLGIADQVLDVLESLNRVGVCFSIPSDCIVNIFNNLIVRLNDE